LLSISKNFNIRVYGILRRNGRVLLCDEVIRGTKVTKFPGGGLEQGEGPRDCVIREFAEETGLKVISVSHFYTTDFFVPSAFDSSQIISIYYEVDVEGELDTDSEISPVEDPAHHNIERFWWKPLDELSPASVNLPIDRHVVQLLAEKRP
jgi:8-oxo-dGTP diphosphatase